MEPFIKKCGKMQLLSGADWILICTFSEWHEGTEIEPSLEYGDLYINITHQFATQWKLS